MVLILKLQILRKEEKMTLSETKELIFTISMIPSDFYNHKFKILILLKINKFMSFYLNFFNSSKLNYIYTRRIVFNRIFCKNSL